MHRDRVVRGDGAWPLYPGVGGARNAIVVQTTRFTFIGPDNGVLSLALAREKITAIHRLKNRKAKSLI